MLNGESHTFVGGRNELFPPKGREGGPLPGRRWAASPLSHTQRAPASPTLQPGLAEEVLLRPRPRGSIRPRDGRAQRRPQPRRGHCSSPGFRGLAREAISRPCELGEGSPARPRRMETPPGEAGGWGGRKRSPAGYGGCGSAGRHGKRPLGTESPRKEAPERRR